MVVFLSLKYFIVKKNNVSNQNSVVENSNNENNNRPLKIWDWSPVIFVRVGEADLATMKPLTRVATTNLGLTDLTQPGVYAIYPHDRDVNNLITLRHCSVKDNAVTFLSSGHGQQSAENQITITFATAEDLVRRTVPGAVFAKIGRQGVVELFVEKGNLPGVFGNEFNRDLKSALADLAQPMFVYNAELGKRVQMGSKITNHNGTFEVNIDGIQTQLTPENLPTFLQHQMPNVLLTMVLYGKAKLQNDNAPATKKTETKETAATEIVATATEIDWSKFA